MSPVEIQLRIDEFPGERGYSHIEGTSYVDCPRLKRFHRQGDAVLMCFRESVGTGLTEDFFYGRNGGENCSDKCRYYRPKKD